MTATSTATDFLTSVTDLLNQTFVEDVPNMADYNADTAREIQALVSKGGTNTRTVEDVVYARYMDMVAARKVSKFVNRLARA